MAQKPEKSATDSFVELIKTIVYALLIAGVFRTLFFQPFFIPSGSMKSTLLIGDFLFVNKMAYGYSYASCPKVPFIGLDADNFCGFIKDRDTRILGGEPERGDVVVFRHPQDGRDFIKRVIGLPGDKVQIKDAVIYINDVAVPTERDGVFVEPSDPRRGHQVCTEGVVGVGADCTKERFTETLPNGVSYSVLNGALTQYDNTDVFNVPAGHFFFMGDNRDNSLDSRASARRNGVGFVPLEEIVGRADRVLFSSAGRSLLAFWTWRGDRFFKAIE